ncbi:MAG: hypothetical protein Tsb0027_07710 [Wenzhouxiangellaceae bacterium]
MSRHRPSTELSTAFQQTRYLVTHNSGRLTLQVDQPPPPRLQQHSWLVISADNPQAQQLPEPANRRRRAALQELLHPLALPMLPTRHVDAKGLWPDEHGWLLLLDERATQVGMFEQLHALGRQFGQLALLEFRHAGDDDHNAVIRLLWL